jgi:hypothetical protein
LRNWGNTVCLESWGRVRPVLSIWVTILSAEREVALKVIKQEFLDDPKRGLHKTAGN